MTLLDVLRIFLTSTFGFTNVLCFSDLRFSKKISFAIITILTIATTSIIVFLNIYNKSLLTSQWFLLYCIQVGIIVATGFLLGKHNGFRTMSSVSIASVYNQIGAIITLSITRLVQNSIVMLLLSFLIYIGLNLLAFFLVRKSLTTLMKMKHSSWKQIFFLSLFVYIIMLVIVPLPSSSGNTDFNPTVGVLLSLSIIWVFIFLRHELVQSNVRAEMEKSKNLVEYQVDKLQKQVQQMEDNEINLAKIRHDLKHNFLILTQLTANKDFEGCSQMLSSLDSSVLKLETSVINQKFCQNRFINAVVTSYYELFKKEKIDLVIEIMLCEPDWDIFLELAVVIGNCLDNALIASIDVLKAKGICNTVKLRCFPAGEQMFLEIINPFLGSITFDKKTGIPLSDKAGHGIGTASTKAFAEKYKAPVSWAIDDEYFTTRIVF